MVRGKGGGGHPSLLSPYAAPIHPQAHGAAPVTRDGPTFRLVVQRRLRAHHSHVVRRRALLALHDVELDCVAFLQGLETVPLNGRVVDEAVLLAVIAGDETEALALVEPLHLAGRTHVPYSSFTC